MKNTLISIKITLTFCVILFVGYILVLWGFAAVVQPNSGRAEVLTLNNKTVGATNIGQKFSKSIYFWSRPSSVNYNGSGSGGSNKSNSNPEYLELISLKIDSFLIAHPYLKRSDVPSEMVTSSSSGLDPHISVKSAMVQAKRVAQARQMSEDEIVSLIEHLKEKPLVGPHYLNVLKLNIALDEKNK